MNLIDAEKVGAIIVKDMSRLGRDYLKVGYYTEILFKENDIRFIAINSGVDSANSNDNDFTPFLNIINEWYAKDTSKKIKAVMRSKGISGKPIGARAPFDSLKNEFQSTFNKNNIEIDNKIENAVALYLAGIKSKRKIKVDKD